MRALVGAQHDRIDLPHELWDSDFGELPWCRWTVDILEVRQLSQNVGQDSHVAPELQPQFVCRSETVGRGSIWWWVGLQTGSHG